MTSIPTIYGNREPTTDDQRYMDYLDNLCDDLPGGYSLGLLIFKADPSAFSMGRDEWLMEQANEDDDG